MLGTKSFLHSQVVTKLHSWQYSRDIVIAFGSNVAGPWGTPETTIFRAIEALSAHGVICHAVSGLYLTRPVGSGDQPAYVNAVAVARCAIPPRPLVGLFKQIEASAGRRRGRKWGPRPVDIDLIDYRGRVLGWRYDETLRRPLVLPHPQAHRRIFVLQPLAEVAPHWRHPVLGRSARQLLARLSVGRGDSVRISP